MTTSLSLERGNMPTKRTRARSGKSETDTATGIGTGTGTVVSSAEVTRAGLVAVVGSGGAGEGVEEGTRTVVLPVMGLTCLYCTQRSI